MCQEFFRTRFLTVPVHTTRNVGIQIGQGACKAVRLRLNIFAINSNVPIPPAGVCLMAYYGDAQSQSNELLAVADVAGGRVQFLQNDWTPLIYCQDLNEVFVRQPATINQVIEIQVMVLD